MSQSFAELGVSEQACAALEKRGITAPFAVQEMVVKDVLAGEDVLVQSPTGSGKTLAFGLPVLERLEAGEHCPSALILAPTRELASQIVDELEVVARSRDINVAAVYGGVGFGPQVKRARRAELIVATPGRLEDLLQRGDISLKHVRMLVLDEADRMLDMGFRPAVDRIVERTRADRQTLFFSATLEGAAGAVARDYTHSPKRHVHAPVDENKGKIDHTFVGVGSRDLKLPALVEQLKGANGGRALVFVRTKRGADRLVKRLGTHKVKAAAMHGNKTQAQRQRALASFERGEVKTLVATDVAARGIDVEDITHVINFDIPEDHETYTHRVGRTGRAGRSGSGISFVLADEHRDMHRMAKALGLSSEFTAALGGDFASQAGAGERTDRRSGGNSSRGGGGNPRGGGGQRNGGSRGGGSQRNGSSRGGGQRSGSRNGGPRSEQSSGGGSSRSGKRSGGSRSAQSSAGGSTKSYRPSRRGR